MATTHDHPEREEVIADGGRRTLVLVGVCLALIAVVASVAGLNVGQQQIAIDLGASQGDVLWVINGYTVALAALLLPIGAMGDRWGRKPVLLAGLAGFTAANILSAFAGSVGVLIVLRILAGVSAAAIMPATLSTITSSFPAESRSTAVGVWSGFAAAGGIIGLVASSAIIDNATWPWLFVPPVIFAVLAAAVVVVAAPNTKEHVPHRFDVAGSLLSAITVGGLVLGIHEGPERGWTSAITLGGLIAGVVALGLFVWWELRTPGPLLDVRVFSSPLLSGGAIGLLVFFAAMFGIFLVLIQFLMVVAGFTALEASAGLLPLALVVMPLSPLAPRLAARFGVRGVLAGGLAIAAAGLAMMAIGADHQTYLGILPGLLVVGVGVGIAMTPATTAITESLPTDKQGVASALNDSVREIGGAIGIALLGSMLTAGYRSSVGDAATTLDPEAAGHVKEGLAGAMQVGAEMGGAEGGALIEAAKSAFVDGWVRSMWVGTAMVLAAALAVAIRMRRHRLHDLNALDHDKAASDVAIAIRKHPAPATTLGDSGAELLHD